MIRSILAFVQIHEPTPIKYVWAVLTLLSVTLKLGIVVRVLLGKTYYPFPLFALYLIISSLDATLRLTPLWGVGGEIMVAVAVALFCIEVVYLSLAAMTHDNYRKYSKWTAIGVAIILISVMAKMAPPPFPHYNQTWYYLRLYSTMICFGAVCGTAAEAWSWKTAPVKVYIAHNLISIPWLGVVVWAMVHRPLDWDWHIAIIGVSVQICCLIAWHVVIGHRHAPRSFYVTRPLHPRAAPPSLHASTR